MKIYVSDEIIEEVKEDHDDVSIHLIAYDYEDMEINSLEQHEQEIRKQERQKVIAELEEFICKNSKTRIISAYDDESEYDTERHIDFQALKQKLNEMKEV